MLLLFALMFTLSKTFSQASAFDVKKYGEHFIECFFTSKVFVSVPLENEAKEAVQQKISNVALEMRQKLGVHKAIFSKILNVDELKDLDLAINFFEVLPNKDLSTGERRMSALLVIALLQTKAEKIFIKLEK